MILKYRHFNTLVSDSQSALVNAQSSGVGLVSVGHLNISKPQTDFIKF